MRFSSSALLALCLDVLAPPRCAACEALSPGEAGYCDDCGTPDPLLDVSRHIDGVPVFAGQRYAEPVVTAMHRFKYGSAPELSRTLALPCGRAIELLGIEPGDVWVPVPLHPLRLSERGYNQATLLARELAGLAGGQLDVRRLRRLRHTDQQAKRGRTLRADNVSGAFVANPRALAARVVLVDDVVTSGATLAACIAALRRAGDELVGCVAAAYAGANEFVHSSRANARIINDAELWSPDWSTLQNKSPSTG